MTEIAGPRAGSRRYRRDPTSSSPQTASNLPEDSTDRHSPPDCEEASTTVAVQAGGSSCLKGPGAERSRSPSGPL
jgi:hypothetical protein